MGGDPAPGIENYSEETAVARTGIYLQRRGVVCCLLLMLNFQHDLDVHVAAVGGGAPSWQPLLGASWSSSRLGPPRDRRLGSIRRWGFFSGGRS